MTRIHIFFGSTLTIIAGILLVTKSGIAGQTDAIVRLQQATPGITQMGNSNISGTSKSGTIQTSGFSMATGAGTGKVLTSDASGNGTWQNSSGLTLPYSGSSNVASPTAAFKVTNTGTGYGIWGEGVDGVRGLSSALGGNGVYGEANNGIGAYGVYGVSNSGRGVFGASSSGSGVYGNSQSGAGVYGISGSYGVYGESSGYFGVYGLSTASGGLAIVGEANNGPAATGVSGGSTSGYGVMGSTSGALGAGVLGRSFATSGANFGGRFENSSTAGYGLLAFSSATSGSTFGGYFQAESTAATGVYGYATATSGFTFGGLFQSNSPDGRAVRAVNNATTGQAVAGRFGTASAAGLAIWSTASAATGTTYGGFFESTSTAGLGVYGQASATTGVTYGGRFVSTSNAGIGVSGVATAGAGAIYGVQGQASGVASYGVYSLGNLGCSGNKQFRIDHPFDPENKYLLHYCAEGPEPLNVYSGNVTTDARGEAWVQLPDYFGEINRDLRYTLTVVDDTDSDQFVMAKVARKVRDNRFKVRTSVPNVEVTWRVEAVRNDLWVQKYGAPVEIDKPQEERGKYQHPELYGYGQDRAIHPILGTASASKLKR